MRDLVCAFDDVSYGVRFRFIAESDELLERMKECAPWNGCGCCTASPTIAAAAEFELAGSGERFRLMCDGAALGDDAGLEKVLELLARNVMVYVANHAPERVFVHAGVVGWQGRALLLPGRSFAGKSTLVEALVRAGAVYYSDEYAVIDADCRIHPYARVLQMRQPGGMMQRPVTMEELQGSEAVGAIPVSYVVFAEFVPDAEWGPEAMSPGTAVLRLMEHAIAVQRTPGRVMATLAKMMETARAMRSERGEALPTAEKLLTMMSAGSAG